MSVGPMGTIGSLAGSPLAQTKGSDVDKTQNAATDQARQISSTKEAEKAAGIGTTDEEHEASDRDADGRRPWELGGQKKQEDGGDAGDSSRGTSADAGERKSKDATGQRGTHLDLSG
jgi:hypothetical protein